MEVISKIAPLCEEYSPALPWRVASANYSVLDASGKEVATTSGPEEARHIMRAVNTFVRLSTLREMNATLTSERDRLLAAMDKIIIGSSDQSVNVQYRSPNNLTKLIQVIHEIAFEAVNPPDGAKYLAERQVMTENLVAG